MTHKEFVQTGNKLQISSITVNRDAFVAALATWLRWRGHSVPHNMLATRFAMLDENLKFADLSRTAQAVGIDLRVKKSKKALPGIADFPLIALMQHGDVKSIRQLDMQGRAIYSQVGAEFAVIDVADIVAWIEIKLSVKKLHHEIFGVDNTAGQWFWSAFSANWWAYLQGAIATGFASLLGLASALYSMQVYDRVVPSDSNSTLTVLTIGVAIVFFLELILRTFRAYAIDYAGKKVDVDVSEKVFYQGVGIRMEARPQHTGTFIAQLREHETLRDFVTSAAIFTLADFPFLLIYLFAIWVIGGNLVLIPLFAIPTLILVTVLLQMPMTKLTQAHIKESNARSGLLIESMEGAETLKTLNAEWRMRRRWRELTDMVSDTTMRIKSISNFSNNFATTVQSLVYVAIVACGALMIRNGDLTAGALIACSILTGRAVAPVSLLIGMITRLYQVRASAQTLDKIMALPIDKPSDANFLMLGGCKGQLNLANVQFSYGNSDVVALDIPHLEIHSGERVALLGRTGSGKSTLLRLLSGLCSSC